MSRMKKKEEKREQLAIKDFFDRILPGVLKFYSDHYICGDSYRCVWAIKEYPPSTEEQAILRQLADRTHVTLRIYNRLVDHFIILNTKICGTCVVVFFTSSTRIAPPVLRLAEKTLNTSPSLLLVRYSTSTPKPRAEGRWPPVAAVKCRPSRQARPSPD